MPARVGPKYVTVFMKQSTKVEMDRIVSDVTGPALPLIRAGSALPKLMSSISLESDSLCDRAYQRLAHQGDDCTVLVNEIFGADWRPVNSSFNLVAERLLDIIDQAESVHLAFVRYRNNGIVLSVLAYA